MPSENGDSLHIAINAQRSPNGGAGGVESVLIGLVSALGRLEDGDEEYIIIGPWENPDWLKPYMGPNQRLMRGPKPEDDQRPFETVPAWLRSAARSVHKWLYDFVNPPSNGFNVPLSKGFYENLGCDVIHFPDQRFTLCALPSVYNPHDLQHLHYPQFFKPSLIQWRESVYQAGCHYARVVVAGSQWVKNDLVEQYGLSPEKIQVIPWGAPTWAIAEPTQELLQSMREKYNLPSEFAFYPSMLWEHKNHLRLLAALAELRDQERLTVRLVCTGNLQSTFWPTIRQSIEKLNLDSQVQFLGMVSPEELRAIYKLSQFVIVPTLFEAASGPVFEAWYEHVPVACSTVTSLPEQAGNAALLFDPFSIEEIANAVQRMATDEQLRDSLRKRGRHRLMDFSWERTAKAYRAVYRRAAGRPLSEEDRQLLSWDWMRNPQRIDAETP
ncbi:MAG: glycosyltransferase family 4 protein [Chloroflexota bacterium]